VCVVLIIANKSCTKLTKVESVVFVEIVSLEEQIDLISSGEDADRSETFSQIGLADGPVPKVVEDGESIVQVEVGLHRQGDLAVFEFFFLGAEVFHTLHEGCLLVGVQHWLHGAELAHGAAPNWRGVWACRRVVHVDDFSDWRSAVARAVVSVDHLAHWRVVQGHSHWRVVQGHSLGQERHSFGQERHSFR